MITIEPITAENVGLFKTVRLRALQDAPHAFSATYAKESTSNKVKSSNSSLTFARILTTFPSYFVALLTTSQNSKRGATLVDVSRALAELPEIATNAARTTIVVILISMSWLNIPFMLGFRVPRVQ